MTTSNRFVPTSSLFAQIPDEVVIRHTCHCRNAAEPAVDGEPEEHVFTVDGQDFPYLHVEDNPVIRRVADDLYIIDVQIILLDKETMQTLPFGYDLPHAQTPLLGGKEFPWTMTGDGFQLNFGHKQLPTLKLGFYAHAVTGNLPVQDQRPHTVAEGTR